MYDIETVTINRSIKKTNKPDKMKKNKQMKHRIIAQEKFQSSRKSNYEEDRGVDWLSS